jgi:hypothetical protein
VIPRGAATGYVQAASGLTFHDPQRQAEDIAPYGVGWYMKSGHARDLSPDLSRRLVDHAVGYRAVASPRVQREVYAIQSLGGAASDVAEGETAYRGRQARWHVAIEVRFTTPDERARVLTTREACCATATCGDGARGSATAVSELSVAFLR